MTPDQENAARVAIHHIMAVYNNAGDRGKIDEMISVFGLLAVLEVGDRAFHGREAIAQFLRSVIDGAAGADFSGSRHHLTTSRIEFGGDDDYALGWTYFFVARRGITLQEGIYVDRFERAESGWRIARRRIKILFAAH